MIQDHLTSQPLSKRLKELGIKQKSEYYWVTGMEVSDFPSGNEYEGWFTKRHKQIVSKRAGLQVIEDKKSGLEDDDDWKGVNVYSAFLSSELGEILIRNYAPAYHLRVYKSADGKWWTNLDTRENSSLKEGLMFEGDTEAECRGLMLEYLILNGLIKL